MLLKLITLDPDPNWSKILDSDPDPDSKDPQHLSRRNRGVAWSDVYVSKYLVKLAVHLLDNFIPNLFLVSFQLATVHTIL